MAESTSKLALYAEFQTARGEKRKALAFDLLTSELDYLVKQIRLRQKAAGTGPTIETTADALRKLAGMLDDALKDPDAAPFVPTVDPHPTPRPTAGL